MGKFLKKHEFTNNREFFYMNFATNEQPYHEGIYT